ncbi:unnamed protein product [Oncorhynchus mykiss]|uniref:Uncharacterized protein n=1 Tax=Oncorhynchus mykiss TaxID=8022 RepID=A0A060X7R5_ONCMY|nr:unnamed protein product [Oncorhynchus mykiss]
MRGPVCVKCGVFVSDEELRRTYLQLDEREEREEELEGLRHHDLLGLLDDLSDNEHDPLTDEAPADFLSGQDFVPGADMDGLSYEDLVKKSVVHIYGLNEPVFLGHVTAINTRGFCVASH